MALFKKKGTETKKDTNKTKKDNSKTKATISNLQRLSRTSTVAGLVENTAKTTRDLVSKDKNEDKTNITKTRTATTARTATSARSERTSRDTESNSRTQRTTKNNRSCR